MYKTVWNKIKDFDSIVIYGHINPDGDCYGSQLGLKRAILDGFAPKKKYFVKMFSAYFAVTVGLIYLHVSVSFFTLGVGELITIPFASLLLVTMKTVDYFTIHKKKYFVDYDTIVVPKELRENDEKLLSDIDI